jgi:uncharacterized protein (TIGR02246 family)
MRVLSPNMFTLFDCNGPYTFHHVEPTEVLDVIVPAGAMRARLSEPEAYIAQPRSADSGLGRVMADMFRSLAREAPLIPEKAADDCARRVADMMGVLFDSGRDDALPIGESAVRSAIYRRCAAFIENNLDDPRLDPAKIAAAAGISVRYLHKIFRGSGESVGDYVRRVRLARSYDDLADLRKKHVKIKEIAFRCGFKNPTHFSDAFKDFHGLSPSEVRRGACLEHDPEKWKPVFRKDHAQIERLMGMTIRRNVIPINTNSSEADMPAADDTEIQRLIGELTDAWKRGDAKAYGARFLSDATFTNVNGEFYVGREAFDRRHAEVFGGVFRYTALAMTINKLRFIRPDVAIADIDTEVSGSRLRPQGVAVGPDGVLRSRLLMALVNERGG